ncbi:MAG: hypothetical protein V7607_6727 [Solirubrobacteraceae bacterium]
MPAARTAQPPSRRPAWAAEFAQTALANALGTLVAALVLFLGGVALGAINDVPTRSVVIAALLLVSLLGLGIGIAGFVRTVPAYLEARRILRRVKRPQARAAAAQRAARDIDSDSIRRKLAAARAAHAAGDEEAAARFVEEAEREVISRDAAIEEAQRRADEFASAAETSGLNEWLLSRGLLDDDDEPPAEH